MSKLSSTSLEIACAALQYSSSALRKQWVNSGVPALKTAADAQDAARTEIRAFLDAPEPVKS